MKPFRLNTGLWLAIPFLVLLSTTHVASSRSISRPMSYQNNPEQVWKDAKARQAKLGGPMIVMEFPTGYQGNQFIANALQKPDAAVSELLGSLTIACLRRDFLTRTLKKVEQKHNIWLVDAKGTILAAAHVDQTSAKVADALSATMHGFLKKDNKKHLLAWAEISRKKLGKAKTEGIEKALVDLDAEGFKARRAAKKLLTANLPSAAPLVLLARYATDSIEVREACKELLGKGAKQARVFGAPSTSSPTIGRGNW